MPKISVIMGVYNGENTVRASIDSILNQTFTDWEFVICDDASTDSTLSILNEYKEKYPDKFVILHNEKNLMLSGSLNRCLEVAKGEYIARMDADDISVINRLQIQVDFLDTHQEYALVGCRMQLFDGSNYGDIVKKINEPGVFDVPKSNPFIHATIVMRKSVYDALNGYSVTERTRRMEDVDLWYRFFAAGYKGYNLDDVLYYDRVDSFAMKKRKLRYSVDASIIVFNGVKKLNLPKKYFIYSLKPLISWFTPERLKSIRRKNK